MTQLPALGSLAVAQSVMASNLQFICFKKKTRNSQAETSSNRKFPDQKDNPCYLAGYARRGENEWGCLAPNPSPLEPCCL